MKPLSPFSQLLEPAPLPPGADDGLRERAVQCLGPHGLHRMAYVEWGDPDNPRVLVCVHGLTRNGRDFDFLARELAQDYRVICPDVVGRGRSDWLAVKDDYGFPLYVSDMITLIARLDVDEVHWVGTSMGGILGMLIAALPQSPISRLVINDVGPRLAATALQRIGEYVGQAPTFATVAEAESYLRRISATFGPLTDAQWQHLTRHSVRTVDGGFAMVYDPALGDVFRKTPAVEDVDLWHAYDAIRCPTLVLRGAESDLLDTETFQAMTTRGPGAQRAEFAGVGHAPMLMEAAQIGRVREFLLAA